MGFFLQIVFFFLRDQPESAKWHPPASPLFLLLSYLLLQIKHVHCAPLNVGHHAPAQGRKRPPKQSCREVSAALQRITVDHLCVS